MLKEIAQAIRNLGGTLYIVGGFVRDQLRGETPLDVDLLVVGLDQTDVVKLFTQHGSFEQVIGNAPVFMWVVDGEHIEVALARKEVSVAEGKHGFEFVADPTVTLEDDLLRRDFTINAMARDVLTDRLHDPFNGRADLEAGMLRMVGPAFVESPERVLRMIGFASRFGFIPDWTLTTTCIEMSLDSVPVEQKWRHWGKILSGRHIGHALRIMSRVDKLPSELLQLRFTPQDSEFHPEGVVFQHTCHTVDAMRQMTDNPKMLLSAICHDMGKPGTTKKVNGRIVSPGHATNVEPIIKFLENIGCPLKIQKGVLSLVKEHTVHFNQPSKRSVRRLSLRLENATIEELGLLVKADLAGRPPLPATMPENMQTILTIAGELDLAKQEVKPLMLGRHLIQLGLKPGKQFGEILDAAFKAQIDGVFETVETGLIWLKGMGWMCLKEVGDDKVEN